MRAPGLRLHVMRYEDMKHRPYKTFAYLSKFLGLPIEPARSKRAIQFSSFKELKKQEDAGGFVEARPDGTARFFREGKAGAWREVLSEAQVKQLIDAHAEVMTEYGYLSKTGEPKV